MRWILFVLVVLNVGFGGYQYWQSTQPTVLTINAVALASLSNLQPTKNQVQRLQEAKRPSDQTQSAAEPTQCIRIEGLVSGENLAVVVSRLQAIEIKAVPEPSKKVVKTDYQVILGPFSNKSLARDALEEVMAKDIESYIISTGVNANALSMGMFSSEKNALRQQSLVASKGVNASIVSKEHLSDAVSLFIDPMSAALVADGTLSSLLAQYEKAEFSRYNCN
ncbi:MAG: hypothetical protein MUQ76_11835 [Reinekea forsetii]|nr:hypothetical protein [Reinekea forsetii]